MAQENDALEVLKRSKRLVQARRDIQESEQLLEKLPQGHGSGLNADLVDGMHAAEILAKAPGKGGGGSGSGSGSGDMTKAVYDPNDDARVVDSDKLQGQTLAQVQDHAPKAHANEAHSTQMATSAELSSHAADPNVHHAQAHTLSSHSTRAHSELTGIGANDHHNQSHGDADHSVAYEKTANKDQASGYAGLSASTKLAASQMPTGKIKTTLSFAVTGTLTTGADKAPTLVAPCSLTITKVKLVVKTAPTGAAIIVDVNKNGTTIFTTQANRPQIAAGATTGDSGTPDVTSLSEGDKLTIDIDQVGSGTAGVDLTVEVICDQAVTFS